MDLTFLDKSFWGNPARDWAIALATCLGVAVGLRVVVAILASRLERLAAHTVTTIDDVVVAALKRTWFLTTLMVGLAVAAPTLELPHAARRGAHVALVVVLALQGGLWLTHAAVAWLHLYRERQLEADRGAATAVGALTFVSRLVIWTMVLLIVLGNLGVDVTALVTGLGIGGLAVALALQNVFSDLFASLSIVFDKPFVIGDFVIVGDHLGVVENVGLKTTRVRSLSGEQIAISNSDLLSSRIRNFGRMQERRVAFSLGVTYQTAQDKLEAIPGIIRAAVENQEKTRFDRSHFKAYGDFALVFETVYYVLGADYTLYMDIQQAMNLEIRRRFQEEGIEFAYPTQTLFLERSAAD